MAVSYRNRFRGCEAEVVAYARQFGRFEAFHHFANKGSLMCFEHYLEEIAGDPNIGMRPQYPTFANLGDNNPVQRFKEKLENYVARIQTQLEERDKRIEFLERQLELYKTEKNQAIIKELIPLLELIGG